jgi:glycosyltransferase involved in cell wall biosynthesis
VSPSRLMFISHSAAPAGAEITLSRMAPHLEDMHPTYAFLEDGPVAVALRKAGHNVVVHAPKNAGPTVHRDSGISGRVRLGMQLVKLGIGLRRHGAPVIVATSLKSAVVAAAATVFSRREMIWWLHDHLSAEYLGKANARFARFAFRTVPNGHIFNSRSTREVAGSPKQRHMILAPSIIEVGPPELATKHREGNSLKVIMLGRISEWKGQHILLEAISRLEPKVVGRVDIVGGALFGENDYYSRLQAMRTEFGLTDVVHFQGHLDHPLSIAQAADVLVHASVLAEPFGTVVVEGMAAGCLVIASNAGGPQEIIEDGRTGFLVRPGDAGALAGRLSDLAAMSQKQRIAMASLAIETSARYRSSELGPLFSEWLRTWCANENPQASST